MLACLLAAFMLQLLSAAACAASHVVDLLLCVSSACCAACIAAFACCAACCAACFAALVAAACSAAFCSLPATACCAACGAAAAAVACDSHHYLCFLFVMAICLLTAFGTASSTCSNDFLFLLLYKSSSSYLSFMYSLLKTVY